MDPANPTDTTDETYDAHAPTRGPPSPGRSDPYENTRVWRPTRMPMDVQDEFFDRGMYSAGGDFGTGRWNSTTTTYSTGGGRGGYSYAQASSYSTTHTTSSSYAYGEPLAQQAFRCCLFLACGAIVTTCCPACNCTCCGCHWLNILSYFL